MPLWIINNRKALYYDIIDVSEGIDDNKTSASKGCDICHYWYFLNYSFKFQPNVCNMCHDLLMMSINLSDVAILNIEVSGYRYIVSSVRKKNKFCHHKTFVCNPNFEKKSLKIRKINSQTGNFL